MEELLPLVSQAQSWADFNLAQKKEAWETGYKQRIEDLKDEGSRARRRLAEHTREVRGMPDDEKVKGFGPLIRAYQEEIDKLNQRSTFTENLYAAVWESLQKVPDPSVMLHAAMKAVKELESEKKDIAAEGFRLRKESANKGKQLEDALQKLENIELTHATAMQDKEKRLAAALSKADGGQSKKTADPEKEQLLQAVRQAQAERDQALEQLRHANNHNDNPNNAGNTAEKDAQLAAARSQGEEWRNERDRLATENAELKGKVTEAEKRVSSETGELAAKLRQVESEALRHREELELVNKNLTEVTQKSRKVDELEKELAAASSGNQILNSSLSSTIDKLEKEKSTLEQSMNTKQQQIESLTNALESKTDANAATHAKRIEELETELVTSKEALAAKEEAAFALHQRLEILENERREAEAQLAQHSRKAAETESSRAAEVNEEAAARNRELADLRAQVEQEKREKEAMVSSLSKKETELNEKVTEITSITDNHNQDISELKRHIDELAKELEASRNQTDHFVLEEKQKAETRFSQIKSQHDSVVAELQTRDILIAQLKHENENKGEAISTLHENAKHLEEVLTQNIKKVSDLERSREEAIAENMLQKGVIEQQLTTISRLSPTDADSSGRPPAESPRDPSNWQDQLVEELTLVVENLRASNGRLTGEVQSQAVMVTQLKEEIKRKDSKDLSSSDGNDAHSEEVEGLQNSNQKLSTELNHLSTLLYRMTEDVGIKDDKIMDLETSLAQANNEVNEAREQSKEALSVAEERANELSRRVDQLTAVADDQKDLIKKLEAKSDQHITEMNSAKAQLSGELQESITRLEADKERLEAKVSELTAHAVNATKSHDELRSAVEKSDSEKSALATKLSEAEARADRLAREKEALVDRATGEKADLVQKLAIEVQEREGRIAALNSQLEQVNGKLQQADQELDSLKLTANSQSDRLVEVEQQLRFKDEEHAVIINKNKSSEALSGELRAKENEIADLKAKHADSIKQLVSQNAELLVQLERSETTQSDLERNLAELANSYRQLNDRADGDGQTKDQLQEALTASKATIKSLQAELEAMKADYQAQITSIQAERDRLSSQSPPLSPPQHSHSDGELGEKYDALVKESHGLHRQIQDLQVELGNARDALRKKEEQMQLMQETETPGGDMWARLPGLAAGNNMVCYAPLAALSYWRRWRGRPADAHTS